MEKSRLLFIYSDTGGGHRSASEAIIEALETGYAGQCRIEMVDLLKEYAPYPFNRLPNIYPELVRRPRGWKHSYRLVDSPRRVRAVNGALWPYVRKAARELVRKHPADLLISVHPIANAPLIRALEQHHRAASRPPPFVVVVTDLVSTHAFWFHRAASLTIVPTEPAARKALDCGLSPQRLKVVGLPVAARFHQDMESAATIRQRLGWPQDRPMVLILGGGDGLGPIENAVRAVASAGLQAGLAVVTGRNQDLRARLSARRWPIPTFIYGFIDQMPAFMRAADVLFSKAGPGTISEALSAGLPMVLYSFLPGQEEGNVGYLTDSGAGIWAPDHAAMVAALRRLLEQEGAYEKAVAACRSLARPQAAAEVADILMAQVR
jgi:1,2-diacylglycerol 3-beta-galactosyltransferase